jgi:hypothetical protein
MSVTSSGSIICSSSKGFETRLESGALALPRTDMDRPPSHATFDGTSQSLDGVKSQQADKTTIFKANSRGLGLLGENPLDTEVIAPQ